MASFQMESARGSPVQGVQYGDQNVQSNYFAPVTQNLFGANFERLRDVCFEPAVLERDLDLAHFTGREWLIRQIDKFIATRRRGYVIIQAEAGVGKSSLAAHLVWTRPWLHHFTRLPGGRSPEAARKSLAAQLIARWRLEEYAPEGILPSSADRVDWFDRLLHSAAQRRDVQEPDEPIVLVIDGLDEAEASAASDAALPLGLPASLPDRVYAVVTSRFGIDRSLHAVRNPADWQQIEVDGIDNLGDMRRFIDDVTDPSSSDRQLADVLKASGVDLAWLRRTLAERCGGVWIYLRYVLDEIRDGMREAGQVDRLPADLAGYYAQQIERWRDEQVGTAGESRWASVNLPLLVTLGAVRAPMTADELSTLAGVHSIERCREFLEETARAFLNRRQDPAGLVRYNVRHQSLRDLVSGVVPDGRPDLRALADLLANQARLAHQKITAALIPAGGVGERKWQDAGPYARDHLAAHAAVCEMLDELATDMGFLIVVTPEALLAQRRHLQSLEGRLAVAALAMSLSGWKECSAAQRAEHLAANAARLNVAPLMDAYAKLASVDWPIRWAAWSGYVYQSFAGHGDWVNAVAVGRVADRDVIISGADDFTVRIWDATNGDPIGSPLVGHKGIVNSVALGRVAGRDVIVSGSHDQTVRMWNADTGEPIGAPLIGHTDWINAVAIGRTGGGHIVVSGSEDGTVRIWDAASGHAIGKPLADHDRVTSVAIGHAGDNDVIIYGSGDGELEVCDAVTGIPLYYPLESRGNIVTSVAIRRVGGRDVIVAGSNEGDIQVWDAITGDPLTGPIVYHSSLVTSVAIGRAWERDVIASGSDDGEIQVWDAATGIRAGSPITGHDGPVSSVAIWRTGGRDVIVSGSHDGTVRVWDDPASGALRGHTAEVRSVAIGRAAGRDVIVSGSDDRTVRVWDAASGTPIGKPLAGHAGTVRSVAIGRAAGRDMIVSGSDDRTVRVWDAASGTPIGKPLAGHITEVNSVTIGRAAGQDVIISGSRDNRVQTWNAATGRPIRYESIGDQAEVSTVAIGRAGGQDVIATGCSNGELWLWNAATGHQISVWTDHERAVNSIAIGQLGDSDVIVSASADRTVLLRANRRSRH
jgi:WD40 repeat protein